MECSLREWRMEDAGELARIISPGVLENLRDGIPFPYTQRDGEEFIASMLSADPRRVFAFAITAQGRLAGSITAFRQENIHCRTAELGYYLGEEWWGRGLASSAVAQASRRVLEKAGFTLEGTLRKNAVKNGEILDMKLYALVREAEEMGTTEKGLKL